MVQQIAPARCDWMASPSACSEPVILSREVHGRMYRLGRRRQQTLKSIACLRVIPSREAGIHAPWMVTVGLNRPLLTNLFLNHLVAVAAFRNNEKSVILSGSVCVICFGRDWLVKGKLIEFQTVIDGSSALNNRYAKHACY